MKIAIAEEDDAIEQVIRGGDPLQEDTVLKLSNSDALRCALSDPDLQVLIIDWTNPRLADPNLGRRIRFRDPSEPYVYLIAVVGPDSTQTRLEAYQAGADAVVEMQADFRQILARLAVARRIVDHEATLRSRSNRLEQARLLLEAENAALSEIASSDALTGLRNRRFFWEALDAQFSLARRKGLPISLVMIDVDEFKTFNDRFGHPAGDEVLRDVGTILRSSVRDHDIVARYGGEEFAILLPATESDECFPLVERLRLRVACHAWPLRPITISLGVATLGLLETQPSDLVDQADRALYLSKALGRNRVTRSHDLSNFPSNAFDVTPNEDPITAQPISNP